MVPSEPGWSINSQGGSLEGSSDRGAFLIGFSINVMLPENAPAGTRLASPYLQAPDALAQIFPVLNPAMGNVRIRSVVNENPLPSFTSSGMYVYDFTINGQPWTGVATVGTDDPSKYSNYLWGIYFSGISVPVGSDGSVGSALVKVWNSWDPSGAIAQRTQRAKELIAETNAVWQEVGEFRRATADRQSRDVGCLLQGYYVIEDNSRKYDLPPLPCGQAYVPGDR